MNILNILNSKAGVSVYKYYAIYKALKKKKERKKKIDTKHRSARNGGKCVLF